MWVLTGFRALFAGPLNYVIGRRKMVMFSNVLFIGGAFMMAFSPAGFLSLIMAGRMVVGLAMGAPNWSLSSDIIRNGVVDCSALYC